LGLGKRSVKPPVEERAALAVGWRIVGASVGLAGAGPNCRIAFVSSPLLVKKRNPKNLALVAHFAGPLRVHYPGAVSALPAADDPVGQRVGDREIAKPADRRLVADESASGRNPREHRPSHAVVLLVLCSGAESDVRIAIGPIGRQHLGDVLGSLREYLPIEFVRGADERK
jgi:hypothetical protein